MLWDIKRFYSEEYEAVQSAERQKGKDGKRNPGGRRREKELPLA